MPLFLQSLFSASRWVRMPWNETKFTYKMQNFEKYGKSEVTGWQAHTTKQFKLSCLETAPSACFPSQQYFSGYLQHAKRKVALLNFLHQYNIQVMKMFCSIKALLKRALKMLRVWYNHTQIVYKNFMTSKFPKIPLFWEVGREHESVFPNEYFRENLWRPYIKLQCHSNFTRLQLNVLLLKIEWLLW